MKQQAKTYKKLTDLFEVCVCQNVIVSVGLSRTAYQPIIEVENLHGPIKVKQ